MHTIILSDGTKLENLKLNGNNYISATELSDSDFTGKLDTVTFIDDEGKESVQTNMSLIACRQYGDEWWFVLQPKTRQQLATEMMASVLAGNSQDITDMQMALVEIYELMLGG